MAHATDGNITPYRPLCIDGRIRVSMYTNRDVSPGEELTWDYGERNSGTNPDLEFLNTKMVKYIKLYLAIKRRNLLKIIVTIMI